MADISWPAAVDVVLSIMDGWTPITREDLDVYQDLVVKLQEVLGTGYTNIGQSHIGPSSGNEDVAARLNRLLDPDGGLFDIAYVSGSLHLGSFAETGAGAYIPFGKSITNKAGFGEDAFGILFMPAAQQTLDEGGTQKWQPETPAQWWIAARAIDGVWIQARDCKGNPIQPQDSGTAQYSMLVFGYGAFSKGRLIL